MANKKFIAFRTIARAEKRAESAGSPITVSALATVLARCSEPVQNAVKDRSSALPYPPLERRAPTLLASACHWMVFRCELGRFFDVIF